MKATVLARFGWGGWLGGWAVQLKPVTGLLFNGNYLSASKSGSHNRDLSVACGIPAKTRDNHPEICLVRVRRNASATVVEGAQFGLRGNVALFSSFAEPTNRLSLVQFDAVP